jgi:rhodanese-related sulfurtransferase
MAKSFQEILAEARDLVPEVTCDFVDKARAAAQAPILLDVREKEEFREGHLPGAVSVPRGFLDIQIEGRVADKSQPLVVYCQSGTRSMLAGRLLKEMGYEDVVSMAGGFGAWKNGGFEWARDRQFTTDQLNRYSRHFLLDEVGEKSPTIWQRLESAPSESSTTTWSTPATCSGRSCTPTTGSGCSRRNRQRSR